jgi:hypothetical protein
MCNAYNHSTYCTCGFGGEGHLGNAWGRNVTEISSVREALARTPVLFSYGRSMKDLSAELGHSVVFPVYCRYCGEPIWLFADPSGGFAIFDALGNEWPKHQCVGVDQATSDYAVRDTLFSRSSKLPVPASAKLQINVPICTEVVVTEACRMVGGAWEITVFDGRSVYRALSAREYLVGNAFYASIVVRDGHSVLVDDVTADLDAQSVPASAVSPFAGSIFDILGLSAAFELQFDYVAVCQSDPDASALLVGALDSLSAGKVVTATISLLRLVLSERNSLPTAVKARHIKLLLNLVEQLQLHALVPEISHRLSTGTRRKLDRSTTEQFDQMVRLGGLKRTLESPSHWLDVASCRWRSEAAFAAQFAGIDFKSLEDLVRGVHPP